MGSILKNASTLQKRSISSRRSAYLDSRKTDRPRVAKREQSIQQAFCAWFVEKFPGEHFVSDTSSGAFNSRYAKADHSRQQSHKHEPDVKILAARRGYHGLLIELKDEGFELRMRRDGRKIRVYKDRDGKIIGHDYKIRKKGDWVSLHVELQAEVLLDYEKNRGYCARFAVGLEHAKKLTCWFFDAPYAPPAENAELF